MKIINYILLLYLSLGILIPKDYIVESFKTPILFTHYKHHIQEHTPITFLSFLKSHYLENNKCPDEKDNNDHEKLPFHHSCSSDCFQLHKIITSNSAHTAYFNLDIFSQQYGIYILSLPGKVCDNIWQPPKVD